MSKLVLVNDRLRLTSMERSDVTEALVSWLNDEEVVRYSRQRFRSHTVESCVAYLNSFNGTRDLYLKILDGPDGTYVGTMTAYYSEATSSYDLGIMVGERSVWGLGVGSLVWQLLMNYLLTCEGVEAVTGGADVNNTAMIKIFKNSGMEFIEHKSCFDDFSSYEVVRYEKRQKGSII